MAALSDGAKEGPRSTSHNVPITAPWYLFFTPASQFLKINSVTRKINQSFRQNPILWHNNDGDDDDDDNTNNNNNNNNNNTNNTNNNNSNNNNKDDNNNNNDKTLLKILCKFFFYFKLILKSLF